MNALTRPELERLYQELESPLYNFALRWVWNPSVAEEMVHEAFVRLWRRRDEVRPDTFKALVYKTLHRLCLNEVRRKKWSSWFGLEEDVAAHGDLHTDYEQKEDIRKLRYALESLSQDLREVLLLTEYSDLSYDEVAKVLAIPAGTVASRKNRALQELRASLKDNEGEGYA